MTAELGNATLKMAGSLILIIGLILVIVYLLKRFRIGTLALNRTPVFRLLGSLSLAPKRSLALVEIHNHWLVLGVGTESVTLLSKMDRPKEEMNDEPQPSPGHKSFKGLMQDFMSGKRNPVSNDSQRPNE